MSMLGDRLGSTAASLHVAGGKKRARMSLRLAPTISRSIGRPIARAA